MAIWYNYYGYGFRPLGCMVGQNPVLFIQAILVIQIFCKEVWSMKKKLLMTSAVIAASFTAFINIEVAISTGSLPA
jgi:hypothetical protein